VTLRVGTYEWVDAFLALTQANQLVMTKLDGGLDGIVVRHEEPRIVLVADPEIQKLRAA
jgi:hypothetical protein